MVFQSKRRFCPTIGLTFGLLLACAGSTEAAPVRSCTSLSALSSAKLHIDLAQDVAAGAFVPPPAAPPEARMDDRFAPRKDWSNVPAFCRVLATVHTSPSSRIQVEVWLPRDTWNGNFLVHAYRYYGGLMEPEILVDALLKGYATATTDNGSGRSQSAKFMFQKPEEVKDWAYRAWHETTATAKLLMRAYYGKPQTTAFFDACGGASRFAMKSMQVYPKDYDLYAVGGHSEDTNHLTFAQWWAWQVTLGPNSLWDKRALLHRAALAACDGNDGLKDGIITDPEHCHFDPVSLQCRAGDALDCLTAAQVEAARKLYSPLRNPRTGAEIQGPRYPGSELTWNEKPGEPPRPFAIDFARYFIFQDPSWDYTKHQIDYDRDVTRADNSPAAAGGAMDPHIAPFLDRGGKLLMYEGWNDANFSKTPINYLHAVERTVGKAEADRAVRLFMVPDMGHCADDRSEFTSTPPPQGPARSLDTLATLKQWQRTDMAPNTMIMHIKKAGRDTTMLLCAYPKSAHYFGGDSADAASYRCEAPAP